MAFPIIPVAASVVGTGLQWLSGKKQEREQAERQQAFLRDLAALEQEQRQRTSSTYLPFIASQAREAGQIATAAATAGGRAPMSYVWADPAMQSARAQGLRTLSQLLDQISNRFAGYRQNVYSQYYNRPVQPNVFDYLGNLVKQAPGIYEGIQRGKLLQNPQMSGQPSSSPFGEIPGVGNSNIPVDFSRPAAGATPGMRLAPSVLGAEDFSTDGYRYLPRIRQYELQ